MAEIDDVPIGSLRWIVTLAKRTQAPSGTGIVETNTGAVSVHADIQPIGAVAFWGAQQVDTPVTHRIRMRWQPYLDQTYVILRTTSLPNGNSRVETFRIRRIKELAGRKRFVECDVELEKAV